MTDKQQTDYNKLVGRIGEEYYFLDYTFEHSPDFRGATGSSIRAVSLAEYEERTSETGLIEYLGELWADAVASGNTELGKDEWCKYVYECDGDEAIFDMSYYNLWDQVRDAEPALTVEAYPIFEAQSGGRCFSKGMKFDKVYAPELLKVIDSFEKPESK